MNENTCNCGPACGTENGCACVPALVKGTKELALYRNMGGERWKIHPETCAAQVRLGDGTDLQTRLNTFEASIGTINAQSHSHPNRNVLDALALFDGRLCVNGTPVFDGKTDIAVIEKGKVPPVNLRDGGLLLVTE